MSRVKPVNTLFHSCRLATYHATKAIGKECCSVEQAFVGRDEIQAPVKAAAWEAYWREALGT